MRRRCPLSALGVAALVLVLTGHALAACPASEPYSSCIDANALWLRSGQSAFAGIGSARATPRGTAGLAFGVTLLHRPLVLGVDGPSAEPREIELVERAVDQHTLLWFGLGHGLTLDAALVSVLRQTGAGPDAIRSQSGSRLERTAVRDTRLGLDFAALDTGALALALRAEVALPTGDETAYAGAGTATWAPATTLELRAAPFRFGVELGARLRRPVELGTLRMGSQLHAAAGASLRLAPELALSVEAFALPSLIDSTSARGRELGVSTRSIPAEWLGLLRWNASSGVSFALGAGSGLPLGAETRRGTTEHFLSPSSPDFRALFDLRYAP